MKILYENKQLNEGPGAGYTISGTLTNVKINNVKSIESAGKDDYGTYFEVELDAIADFVDVRAESYYYGGNIDSTPVSIIRARINSENEPTIEEVKDIIEDAKIKVTIGAGWLYSTFDGFIEGDLNKSPSSIDTYESILDGILFELTDKKAVEYLDRAVQNGNTETSYEVVIDGEGEDAFDTREEAIEYAKKYGGEAIREIYQTEFFNGDVDIEIGDIVWTNDDMNESLKESEDTIEKETDDGLSRGSVKEMSNVIFDTLFNNTQYPQFDFSKVENQEVDANKGQIVFDYMGHEYKITVEESVGHFTESVTKTLTEDFSEDERIQALAEYLGIDPSEISNIYDYEFETPEGDYLVVDEDEARELAEDDIRSLYDDLGLDSFTPDFKDWIIMNALDNDWFEDAVRESYEYYVEDIESDSSSMGYENRLIEELHDNDIISDSDFAIDEDGEPNLGELNDDVDIDYAKEQYVDYLVEQAGDPVEYCADNFGWGWVTDAATNNNLIDMDEVVEQAIYMDGIAHFIARYDGNEIYLDGGLFAYRTN